MGGTCPDPHSLKRNGAPLDAPGSRVPNTGDTSPSAREDLAFTRRHKIGLHEAQVVVTVSQSPTARDKSPRGPRAQARMAGPCQWVIPPWLLVIRPLPKKLIGTLARTMDGWPEPRRNLLRRLSTSLGGRVDGGDFRALDADSGLLRPLVGRGYQV